MKVAVIGSGISGLAAAHHLQGQAAITLFEAGDYFGGHTHTVDLTLPDATGRAVTHGVDTGFLVFNERTYPELIRLLGELSVPTVRSDMSFSVQVPRAFGEHPLEWSGSDLGTVFSQRTNLLRPRFWRMLADLVRFNRIATHLAQEHTAEEWQQPLAEFLRAHRFSDQFVAWYLLPMIGCIWSCPTQQMLRFPVATLIRFCHNHGLLQVTDRPQWWTVPGGARQYVQRIVETIPDARLSTPVTAIARRIDGVHLRSQEQWERFDALVLATHSDQALALLSDPTPLETATLGAIRYHPNRAVLHTDASVLPNNKLAWAAWNYERGNTPQVCLHYLINKLQPIPFTQPVLVSLNPMREIPRAHGLGEYDYAHPVFDLAAMAAQARVPQLQGQQHTYFCGAWMGYGFHEDGLKAGLGVARSLLAGFDRRAPPPHETPAQSPAHAQERTPELA